jgi:Tfp pilus assembly protein PilF
VGLALVLVAKARLPNSSSEDYKRQANQLLLEAIERDSNRSMAHPAMGRLRTIQDRQAEALVEYRTAIALDPNNAWALTRLGQNFTFVGQTGTMHPLYRKSAEAQPARNSR